MRIAVASGKGGTGKTFVSTNLFAVAEKEYRDLTLVDCDAEEPNVTVFIDGNTISTDIINQHLPVIDKEACVYCGKCRDWCNYNAIICLPENKQIYLIEDLCHDCGACLAACQYNAITEIEKKLGTVTIKQYSDAARIIEARADIGVYSPVQVIKAALNKAENAELILMDSPPGISCPFIAAVVPADYVVLVTEPTPFGLNDLKLSVETLQQLEKPFGVIVNRAGLGDDRVYDWLEEKHIPLLMKIPFDKNIARIYSQSRLLVREDPSYEARFLDLLKTIEGSCKN
ncbi:MAG TPA: ATP-binding protein [Bacteroidales bacterium]|nr:ATP-binding protein [Bacteroidales bacterium]